MLSPLEPGKINITPMGVMSDRQGGVGGDFAIAGGQWVDETDGTVRQLGTDDANTFRSRSDDVLPPKLRRYPIVTVAFGDAAKVSFPGDSFWHEVSGPSGAIAAAIIEEAAAKPKAVNCNYHKRKFDAAWYNILLLSVIAD